MDFGDAIRALKAGKLVTRQGWNGKNMYLYLEERLEGQEAVYEPCIVMRNAQGKYQPGWLASQADVLADDWVLVEIK